MDVCAICCEASAHHLMTDVSVPLRWPPIETDPTIFTSMAHALGLDPAYTLTELLDLDGSLYSPSDSPSPQQSCQGFIVCYEDSSLAVNYDECGSAADIADQQQQLTFIKQVDELDTACGFIALLHVIVNLQLDSSSPPVVEGSPLDKFLERVRPLDPHARGQALAHDESIRQQYTQAALRGQSHVPATENEVKHHYVGLVRVGGRLVVLDGVKERPMCVGEVGGEDATSMLAAMKGFVTTCMKGQVEAGMLSVLALSKSG